MQRLMALTVALMTSAMLANTVSADGRSHRGLCRALEDRVERCDSTARSSTGTQASCDRTEEAYGVLCGAPETIVATESADSAALDLLRQDYEIVPIEDAVVPYLHLVIGPDDLGDPHVADLVRRTYRAGKTVAMTFATADEVRRFHRLVYPGQAADCVSPDDPSGALELYGLQESLNPPRTASYCLQSLNERDPASDRRWLRERFASKVPSQSPPIPVGDASSIALAAIASKKTCLYNNSVQNIAEDGTIEIDIWSMRSLDLPSGTSTKEDFYLVYVTFAATPRASGVPQYSFSVFRPQETNGSSTENIQAGSGSNVTANIPVNTPPTTQSYTSQIVNDQSTTTNGTIGFNGSSVNGQVSTTTTTEYNKTTTVPPILISNIVDQQTLEPGWIFEPQSANTDDKFSANMEWVWVIQQAAYPLGGDNSNQLTFKSEGEVSFGTTQNATFGPVTCNVTVPFPVWTVDAPAITGFSQNPVDTGDQVTIQGSNLYPNIVTAVLINGTAIPAVNINITSSTATALSITVPGSARSGPVQVNTTAGNSTNNPTLTITNSSP